MDKMDTKAIFEDIVCNPGKWLLDTETVEDYKRALSVLIEEDHSDPYGYLLEIIETEVHKRVSDKLFEVTQQCAADYAIKKNA